MKIETGAREKGSYASPVAGIGWPALVTPTYDHRRWKPSRSFSGRTAIVHAVTRLVAIVCAALLAGVSPASAWWRYAEWGMTEGQIRSASQGTAVPCEGSAPVCAATASGAVPRLYVPSVNVIGLQASTAFVFDGSGHLSQTIVLFPNADAALVTSALQGALGTAAEDRPGPTKVWRDERHGSLITATTGSAGTVLVYQRLNR